LRTARLIPVLLAMTLAVFARAIPGVLIVQESMPNDDAGNDPNVAIGNVLANELEKVGLLAPVVWSQTDPIFRSAVNDGLIKDSDKTPDLGAARKAADKLHVEYIIFVRSYQSPNALMGRLQLYKGTKLIWKDPDKPLEQLDGTKPEAITSKNKNGQTVKTYPQQKINKIDARPMTVMGPDGLLVDDAALSLVRTWVTLMAADPLKSLGVSPKYQSPDASPGQQPKIPVEAVVPSTVKVDNKQLLTDLDAMIKGGQSIPAILMLRDAVDVAPQDVERRVALVRTLLLVNQPELAAAEARRAAELLPDKIELRAMAARAWMQAGREDEAMADLNEAVARDPNSVETRTLLADVNLSKGRPEQALEHLDAVVKEKPTGEAWFKHALCNALLGKKDAVVSDLAKAKEVGYAGSSQDAEARYGFAVDLLQKRVAKMGDDLRSLMQRAQVKRTDPEVTQAATELRNLSQALEALLSTCEVPTLHRSSHDRRVLAFNLLSQTLGDLTSFLGSNDEDTLAEARINLGEALKQNGLAQTAYRTEIEGTSKRVGTD